MNSTTAGDQWKKVEELARTNAIAAQVVWLRRNGAAGDHAALIGLIAALESNELLLERARNLIALMPPAPRAVAGARA